MRSDLMSVALALMEPVMGSFPEVPVVSIYVSNSWHTCIFAFVTFSMCTGVPS